MAFLLLYLDDYHLGDLFFQQHLARVIARCPPERPPLVLLHGSGEPAERALEGQGLFPERVDGVLQVQTPEEAALVERAVRQANRRLVGMLTDEVVPAVGVQGSDRGVLRVDEAGAVVPGPVRWMVELVQRQTVLVVSALAQAPAGGAVREVSLAVAAARLAPALAQSAGREVEVVFFAKGTQAGQARVDSGQDPVPVAALARDGDLEDVEAVRAVVAAGVPARLTTVADLFVTGGPPGRRVIP